MYMMIYIILSFQLLGVMKYHYTVQFVKYSRSVLFE